MGVPESALLGRERIQRHYDADDNLTGYTVIEPEFTEADLQGLEALALYESKLCQGCGWHESQAVESNHFDFKNSHCPVCAWTAQFGRRQQAADADEAKKLEKVAPHEPRSSDGRSTRIHLRPSLPDD